MTLGNSTGIQDGVAIDAAANNKNNSDTNDSMDSILSRSNGTGDPVLRRSGKNLLKKSSYKDVRFANLNLSTGKKKKGRKRKKERKKEAYFKRCMFFE